jgi:hypothetical protein
MGQCTIPSLMIGVYRWFERSGITPADLEADVIQPAECRNKLDTHLAKMLGRLLGSFLNILQSIWNQYLIELFVPKGWILAQYHF